MRFLQSKRGLAGVGALVIVGVMGFLVLPAIASNPGDQIGPAAQPSGVYPTDVQIGGNGT